MNKFIVFSQWQHSCHHTETIFSVPNHTTCIPNPAINCLISTWLNSTLSTRLYIHLPLDRGFPWSSDGKESACNVGDLGSISGFRRSPGEGKGYPYQYSGLENFMDCIVHGVTNSWTQLRDFHFIRIFVLSPSFYCSLHNKQQANKSRWVIGTRNSDFIWKASRLRRFWTQKTILPELEFRLLLCWKGKPNIS